MNKGFRFGRIGAIVRFRRALASMVEYRGF